MALGDRGTIVRHRTLGLGVFLALLLLACQSPETVDSEELTPPAFRILLETLATSWESQDTATAVGLFAADAVYMQPPDVQLFVGRAQLDAFFGALRPGTFMHWHNVWFEPDSQIGAGEFTFGTAGQDKATHGVAVVQLRNGRIASWHEYLQDGPSNRETFLSTHGKRWTWHIGNYP
jgi:ketosteroid isomerase-like protein